MNDPTIDKTDQLQNTINTLVRRIRALQHSQIDYIISSSTTLHLYQNTEYEEELLSDHKGISVISPLLFPEFHTQSTKKCILDWRTFDNWAYKLISETELDTSVASGNWHDQSIEGKIELFTKIQKFSLQNTIQLKETSTRGKQNQDG